MAVLTEQSGDPVEDSGGSELIRNRAGELYFSMAFRPKDPNQEDPDFFTAHIEMSGEKWLRDQGFEEGDRIRGSQIRWLLKNKYLYTNRSGTIGSGYRRSR
jgi:hypothetical protein